MKRTLVVSSAARAALVAVSLPIACAATDGTTQPVPSAAEPGVTAPVARAPLVYFQGTFDPQQQRLDLLVRDDTNPVLAQDTLHPEALSYGTGTNNVYLHTASVFYDTSSTPGCGGTVSAPRVCAFVSLVNRYASSVLGTQATLDSFTPSTVSALGAPYVYGTVVKNGSSATIEWVIDDPKGVAFTFSGHVEGWSGGTGNKRTYSYVDFTNQTFAVPSGVTSVVVTAWGAGGGGGDNTAANPNLASTLTGGAGGYSTAKIAVTPGEDLTVIVGQGGGYGGQFANLTEGGGGGRCAVQRSSNDLVTAGGGGGAGEQTPTGQSHSGGGGGGTEGEGAGNTAGGGIGGGGATQSQGGSAYQWVPGSQYTGGPGQCGNGCTCGPDMFGGGGQACDLPGPGGGGGGGGGYYGGGGGVGGGSWEGAGGGGGSGYAPGGTMISATSASPPATSSSVYTSGVGGGGALGAPGKNGYLVIEW